LLRLIAVMEVIEVQFLIGLWVIRAGSHRRL